MSKVTLDYATPPEALRSYLSVFYEFRADVPVYEDLERAGLAQVRFILAGQKGRYRFADGGEQIAPPIHILGPTTGPTLVHIDGPVHIFGTGLLPSGWAAMLDFEASVLVNRVIDATDLFGKRLYKRLQEFQAATTLEQKVAIGSEIGYQLVAMGRPAAFDFTRIVDDWLADAPSPCVSVLVAATGLSRRQVERNCKAYYGSPPKLLARKYRALRAAIAIAKHEVECNDLLDTGFYDQSHFIREIKHFTGVTPRSIRGDLPSLANLILKRTEVEGVHPLVIRA